MSTKNSPEPSARPAPRVRKSPAERHAEIQDAAAVVALEEGLAAITLRRVARQLGVASGLVAHYEPRVEDFVAATFARIAAADRTEVEQAMAGLDDVALRLRAVLASSLDSERLPVTAVWVEAWGLGRRNEALAAAVREEMDSWQELLRNVIRDGVRAGVYSAPDPAAVAWQVLGMIDGLNAQALVRWEGVPDRREHFLSAVEHLLGVS
ncbi:TetR family transcriptional regulator C-terminal domain-containing protein [Arthrobacter woluwensis]|jgi:AcrR family transcriptional regulator|uniref:TetR family transcriptional regulator C-terminal domain-containing protein n=1 Tax=Arthrobacter woluwensis TaxID=156980 RepID=UPI001AB00512|nr:TetR family transcriptional regulator C-terminal domain-containing protein [Arthrobacter woluwensis]QTF72487.1 TetR family transcriptional regulator [Arthrobacter woluwensis]